MGKKDLSAFRLDQIFKGLDPKTVNLPNNLPFPIPLPQEKPYNNGVKELLKVGLKGELEVLEKNLFRYVVDLYEIIGTKSLCETVIRGRIKIPTIFSEDSTFSFDNGRLKFRFKIKNDVPIPFDPFSEEGIDLKSVISGTLLRGLFYEMFYAIHEDKKQPNHFITRSGWLKSSFDHIDVSLIREDSWKTIKELSNDFDRQKNVHVKNKTFSQEIDERDKYEDQLRKKYTLQELAERARNTVQNLKKETVVSQFARNNNVAAFAKEVANGICQLCKSAAPFARKNGELYLEVHHVEQLSEGGEDTIENAVALCPNCHRKMHHANDLEVDEDKIRLKNIAKQNALKSK